LLGAAVGDALGIAYENLAPRRALRLFPRTDAYHLLPKVGLISDDAEHVIMTARALARSGGEPAQFLCGLAQELRLWIVSLPAGTGLATARAGVKLWYGVSPYQSGVFSAGNAPALRAGLIGVACANDAVLRESLLPLSTRLTHTDPKALHGAQVAAALGAHAAQRFRQRLTPDTVASLVQNTDAELRALLEATLESVVQAQSPEAFAQSQGWTRGVSGYIYHTIAVALHAWLSYPQSFEQSVQSLIRCGGDTDSTAALLGLWIGAQWGASAIPERWRQRLLDPLARPSMLRQTAQAVADSLTNRQATPIARPMFLLRLGRNCMFLALVLAHVVRRALPPY
jgi:ADP-ribosylglycohydrolase